MKGTSKLPSRHLSADRPLQRLRGCFLGDNAAVPPAYRVKVQKCASFVDILDVCKFTTFCDRKVYTPQSPSRPLACARSTVLLRMLKSLEGVRCDGRATGARRARAISATSLRATSFRHRCDKRATGLCLARDEYAPSLRRARDKSATSLRQARDRFARSL